MSAAQLGWDTTMNIYLPVSNTIRPSYKVGNKFEGVHGNGRYNIHWVIDVDDKKGKLEKYVAVSIISAIRSAEICARSTVVFEVIKYNERENPKQTYALKRYWRPIRGGDPELYPTEGRIYEILDGVDLKHIIAYADIEIDGHLDTTFELSRRNLVIQRYKPPVDKPAGPKIRETDADAENHVDKRQDVSALNPTTVVPIDRCHTYILMPMGESIRRFCDLLEVLSCFQDYVEELQHGNNELIIHRDVSTGNLLIFERSDGKTFGRVMDYDHAKKAKEKIDITSYIRDLSSSELDIERKALQTILSHERRRKADNVVVGLNRQVDNEVLDRALKWFPEPIIGALYIAAVAKSTGLGNNASEKSICLSDLGWDEKDGVDKWPDFANRKHGPGERT
ncbi:hypothetical protein C0995_013917, partial [Termitomyces sp. Mi166